MDLFMFLKSLEKGEIVRLFVLPREILHRIKQQLKISEFVLHMDTGFSPLCLLAVHEMAKKKKTVRYFIFINLIL